MAKSIQELLKMAAEATRSSELATDELNKRLENASKQIGKVKCSLKATPSGIIVGLDPGGCEGIMIYADLFDHICGWFGKHYIGGVMDEDGKPETEKES